MKGSMVMQASFHQNKLGQLKSKLVTNLVDRCGLQVPGFQSPPPVGVCGAHETCRCIFSLLNILCDSIIFFLSLARQLCLARLDGGGSSDPPCLSWSCHEACDWLARM